MARRILDSTIMSKLAKNLGKRNVFAVNKMVSKKAARLGISSEAALILLAKQHGIGTSIYQRRLDATKQAEVRDALPSLFVPPARVGVGKNKSHKGTKATDSKKTSLKFAIEYLIQDQQLRSRCADILMASANFDRPINQATLILEDRIRRKSQPHKRMVGENLVGFAFNEDAMKTVLQVASKDPEDQRGFTQIIRGIVPAFRNATHHNLIDTFSRQEAMRVCGFIDVLLRVVDNSVKVR